MSIETIKVKILKDTELRKQHLYKDSVILLKKIDADYLIDLELAIESHEEIDTVVQVPKQEVIDKQELKKLRLEVLQQIFEKNKDVATELIVKFIEKKYKIYTTRNDDKSEMWIYEEGIYIPHGKTVIKEVCRQILNDKISSQMLNIIILKVETDTYIKEDEFFKNNYVNEIPVKNGILCTKTKKLSKFDSKKVFFNKLEIEYKPECKCNKIIQFFKDIIKHEEDLEVIQEMLGWCLYKDYFIEKAFMLSGNGRNGKGKTLEIIRRLVNPLNCSNVPLQRFGVDQYAMSSLMNKMVNIGGDLSSEAFKDTSTFKTLTGRDSITAQRKYLNAIEFVNYAKMIFACNELPRIYDNSHGFWSRWIVIEFPYVFIEKSEYDKLEDKTGYKIMDPTIIDKITTDEEMSGLLNWALEGLERLFNSGSFSLSKNTEEVKNLWIRKADSFAAFCMDNIEESYEDHISKQKLKYKYVEYCRLNKIKVLSDKYIKNKLSEFGAFDDRISIDGEQVYCWIGIKLKQPISQGSQDSEGFSTFMESKKVPIRSERVANLATLTRFDKLKIDKNYIIRLYNELAASGSDEIGFHFDDFLQNCENDEIKKKVENIINSLILDGTFFEPQKGYIKLL